MHSSKHNINVFINRQLIYNYPEQLFADAGVMAIEHADFEGVERLALVTGEKLFPTLNAVKMSNWGKKCDRIEEVMIGEDHLLKFSGLPIGESCTIVLCGATEQILNEAERALHDVLCVLITTVQESLIVLGGGSTEMLMARRVLGKAAGNFWKESLAMEAYARALMQGPVLRRSERIKKLKEKKKLELQLRSRLIQSGQQQKTHFKCNNYQSARSMDLPTWYSYLVGNKQITNNRSGSSTRERRAGFESQGTNNVVRSPCIGCNENEVRSVHQYYRQPRVKRNDAQGQSRPIDVPLAENMIANSSNSHLVFGHSCKLFPPFGNLIDLMGRIASFWKKYYQNVITFQFQFEMPYESTDVKATKDGHWPRWIVGGSCPAIRFTLFFSYGL
ncbi:t-complex protein 1 subunit beta [Caerostris extrusa]|uniref:T-complex protein 1 subunit beta n=1 Tax=Caerostris extrusa TaxID=172846 RepID=A0AAV4N9H4_CAEEX|nr:t-complex protein 1 subunit beta [Caerostris extrusa]